MKRSCSICLAFVLFSFLSSAQKLNYSISLKYNQSYTSTIVKDQYLYLHSPVTGYSTYFTNSGYKETYNSKSGGKISGQFSYSINSKVFIEGGLQLNLVRFQQETEVLISELSQFEINYEFDLIDSAGNPMFPVITLDNAIYKDQDKLGNTLALYTEIPIQVGYTFFNNKLKCKIGVVTSFLAYAEVYVYDYQNSNLYTTISVKKDKTADGFKNLMWSSNIELEYLIYKNISLNLGYTRSLNSFYDENISVGNPKYNLFEAGLTYNFMK